MRAVMADAHNQVPRSADHEAQVQWLYSWCKRIDAWITENRPGDLAMPAVAAGYE